MKKKDANRPIAAICYDFDKTLSPKDMQEYTLIPKLGKGTDEFWQASERYADEHGMDKILSYMRLIVKYADEKKDEFALNEKRFREMGRDVELFAGAESWFDRINAYADELGICVEHYIISAGLKEIIEGTKIAKYFKEIYASCFVYAANGDPVWPRQAVNYTQKTQYLFRINKNCLDLSDEKSINRTIPASERRVPFENFIYIGDSETDIPAMKLVKMQKGHSIGVYDPATRGAQKACKLLDDDRIDFFAPADYREGSELDSYVKLVLNEIKAAELLKRVNVLQSGMRYLLGYYEGALAYDEELIDQAGNIDDLSSVGKHAAALTNRVKSELKKNYANEAVNAADIVGIISERYSLFNGKLKEKRKILGEK